RRIRAEVAGALQTRTDMNPSEIPRGGKNQPSVEDHLPEEGDGTDGAVVNGDPVMEPLKARKESRTDCVGNGLMPPRQHPYDPVKKDLDPIGFALYRVQSFLVWIEEHRAA